MTQSLIVVEQREAIFEIRLNRPEKRNAITFEMWQEIERAADQAERAEGVRAVIVRGEGSCFSAGIDLASLMDVAQGFGENWKSRMRSITARYQAVVNRLERLEIPVIALLHGHCLGLGLELALACDIRLAAEGAKLGLPETLRGLVPDVGGTTRLTRLTGPAVAKELIFTGRSLDAGEALRLGLVNRVVPEGDDLLQVGKALAEEIARAAPLAVGAAKRIIDGLFDSDRGLQIEGWAQSQLIASQDLMEGIQAFFEKRPARFTGK